MVNRRKNVLRVGYFALFFLLSAEGSVFASTSEGAPANTYSAEIVWKTDKPATSQVEYTEDIFKGYTHKTETDPALVTSHKLTLTGLKGNTIYHYRVRSIDTNGNETVGKDLPLLVSKAGLDLPLEISEVQAGNIIAAGPAAKPKNRDEAIEQAFASLETGANAPGQEDKTTAGESMVMKEKPVEEVLIQRNALLLPKGTLQLEPAYTYAHVSANRIAFDGIAILPILVVGQISSEEVKRDIYIPSITARYGLTDTLEWTGKVPYRIQTERVANSNNTETNYNTSGIGDVETGMFYQFFYERGPLPGLIGGINVKSNTGRSPYGREIGLGTGHWGIKANVVAVKTSDPVILYGSLGYTWNLERNIKDFGHVDPGDTFDYSLGLAFALNYQAAINLQVEQQITDSMIMNGNKVADSFTNAATFKAGLTYSISRNFSVDINAGWGLTKDSPDFILELRFPYTF